MNQRHSINKNFNHPQYIHDACVTHFITKNNKYGVHLLNHTYTLQHGLTREVQHPRYPQGKHPAPAMPLDKTELVTLIEHAFANVSRGDGISLHEAAAIDDHASEAIRKAARLKDVDAHWREVPDQHIAAHDAVFSFLDIKGHVYHAPAYMLWFLRTGYDTRSNSVMFAQSAFNPWGKHEGGSRHRPHDMFTPAQCACIAQYHLYVSEVLDGDSSCSTAREYLDAYWSRFL